MLRPGAEATDAVGTAMNPFVLSSLALGTAAWTSAR